MRQYLTATIQALSKSELDELVDPLVKRHIRENDPDPDIRVYSVGHDGEANLHLPGIGNKTLTWMQAAVRWVADKLRLGTAVFNRHDPNTNSHEGRVQIGEVVGKAVKQIGDRLNTLAAIYVYPQYKSRPLDVASIEAEIEYAHDGVQAWPTEIKNVSGVALSTSDIDTPGFPGATLIGAVQAYVQAFKGEISGELTMNQSDVKTAVKDLGLKPSQIFAIEDIMGDTVVAAKVQESKSVLQNAADRWKGEVDTLKEKATKLENEKADSDKKLQQFQIRSKSSSVIDGILSERKFDDKAKKYIKRSLDDKFTTTATDEEGLKKDLGVFVDNANKEYQEVAKDIFGITGENTSGTPNTPQNQFRLPPELLAGGNRQEHNTQIPTYKPRDEMIRDEMNPDLNPLIPGGKAAKEALTPK